MCVSGEGGCSDLICYICLRISFVFVCVCACLLGNNGLLSLPEQKHSYYSCLSHIHTDLPPSPPIPQPLLNTASTLKSYFKNTITSIFKHGEIASMLKKKGGLWGLNEKGVVVMLVVVVAVVVVKKKIH